MATSWTYSDWDQQSTVSARLTRLKLHMQEVRDEINARVSSGDKSRDPQPLVDYLKELRLDRVELEQRGGSGSVSRANLHRPGIGENA